MFPPMRAALESAGDAVMLLGLIFLVPIAIIVAGIPIAMLSRLILELAARF